MLEEILGSRNVDKKVSYRKQIPRQHLFHKKIVLGKRRGQPWRRWGFASSNGGVPYLLKVETRPAPKSYRALGQTVWGIGRVQKIGGRWGPAL